MPRPIAGLIALAVLTAAACKADRMPVRQTGASASTTSSGATVAVAPGTVADPAHAACGTVGELLRSAAAAVGDRPSAITPPHDTTDGITGTLETACVITWRDSTAHALPVRDVYARLERAGWQRRERLVDASGPGSEALAFSRGGAACVIYGEEDVEDDADSTYVPRPGFVITATCYRDRPDPR